MAISRIRIPFSIGHDVITSPGHWLRTTSKDLFSLSRGLSEEGKTIWRIAMAISKNEFWLSRKPRDRHVIRHRVRTTSMDRFSRADGPFESVKMLRRIAMALHQKKKCFSGSDPGFIMKE